MEAPIQGWQPISEKYDWGCPEKTVNPTFCRLYPEGGRPSICLEQQLLVLLLQAIYGIRSERMLIELLDYNLLRQNS